MNTDNQKKAIETRKVFFWSCLIIVSLVGISILSFAILITFSLRAGFTMSEEDARFLPGKDTVASYQGGKYQILKRAIPGGDKVFDLYDNSLNSHVITNIKKWKLVTTRTGQYVCTFDENDHFYILNLKNGDMLGPLSLEETPKDLTRTCKSMM